MISLAASSYPWIRPWTGCLGEALLGHEGRPGAKMGDSEGDGGTPVDAKIHDNLNATRDV